MSSAEHPWTWQAAIAWTGLIVAACAVYFSGISHELIWYDESVSAAIANHSITEIFKLMPNENHPPLHFLLLRLVRAVFGNSESALRLVSAFGAVGLVALGAGPVRRLLGDRAGFAYAGVVLFTPVMLIYAHEARMYSLCNLAVTATALYGLLSARGGRSHDWLCFGVASLCASYLHYYGLIAAALVHLFVLCWVLFGNPRQLKRCLVTAALTLAGYLPWLMVLAGQTRRVNKTGFWIPPVSVAEVLAAIFKPFTYRELFPMPFPIVRPWMALALLVSLLLIVTGLVLVRRKRAQPELALSTLLLTTYIGTLLVAIAISLVSVPVFYSRYMVVCTGLFALLVSLGIAALPGQWLPGAAIVVLGALNSFTLKDIYTKTFNLPFRQVVQALAGQIKAGDLIITSDCFTVGPAVHYFPKAVHYYSSNSIEAQRDEVLKVMTPPLRYNEGLKELLSTRKSFWSISDSTGLGRDISDILTGVPGWHVSGKPSTFSDPVPFSFVSFTLAKYQNTDHESIANGQGNLKIHVTGLRPSGTLAAMVCDRFPLPKYTLPFRIQFINVSGDQLDTTISNLDHGEYVLMLWHDENKNYQLDFKDGMPAEGTWVANEDKVNRSLGLEGFTFDVLKFSFQELERDFQAKLNYPPSAKH